MFLIDATLQESYYRRQSNWKVVLDKLTTDAPSATWVRAPGTLEGDSETKR